MASKQLPLCLLTLLFFSQLLGSSHPKIDLVTQRNATLPADATFIDYTELANVCSFNLEDDRDLYYCGFYHGLRLPSVQEQDALSNPFNVLADSQVSRHYAVIVDLSTEEASQNVSAILKVDSDSTATQLPQVTNITSTREDYIDASLRRFYESTCLEEDEEFGCSSSSLDFNMQKGYPGKLIYILESKKRPFGFGLWPVQGSTEDLIQLNFKMVDKDGELIEERAWSINTRIGLPPLKLVTNSQAQLMSLATTTFAFVALVISLMRSVACNCWKSQKKLSYLEALQILRQKRLESEKPMFSSCFKKKLDPVNKIRQAIEDVDSDDEHLRMIEDKVTYDENDIESHVLSQGEVNNLNKFRRNLAKEIVKNDLRRGDFEQIDELDEEQFMTDKKRVLGNQMVDEDEVKIGSKGKEDMIISFEDLDKSGLRDGKVTPGLRASEAAGIKRKRTHMGSGLGDMTIEPSEFGSNLDADGKPRTNQNKLDHKIKHDERFDLESGDEMNISSRLFNPIECPPEFVEMNFDFHKNKKKGSPIKTGGGRADEESISILKGENYKSKNIRPPQISEKDDAAYHSDDNAFLDNILNMKRSTNKKNHEKRCNFRLQTAALIEQSGAKADGCHTSREDSIMSSPTKKGSPKKKKGTTAKKKKKNNRYDEIQEEDDKISDLIKEIVSGKKRAKEIKQSKKKQRKAPDLQSVQSFAKNSVNPTLARRLHMPKADSLERPKSHMENTAKKRKGRYRSIDRPISKDQSSIVTGMKPSGGTQRAKFPPQIKLSTSERRAIRDQSVFKSMVEKSHLLSRYGDHENYVGRLDLMDKLALDNWTKNLKHFHKINKLQLSNGASLAQLNRIVDMYKIYGSDATALINPKENPFILQVRDRDFAEMRQIDQMTNLQGQRLSINGDQLSLKSFESPSVKQQRKQSQQKLLNSPPSISKGLAQRSKGLLHNSVAVEETKILDEDTPVKDDVYRLKQFLRKNRQKMSPTRQLQGYASDDKGSASSIKKGRQTEQPNQSQGDKQHSISQKLKSQKQTKEEQKLARQKQVSKMTHVVAHEMSTSGNMSKQLYYAAANGLTSVNSSTNGQKQPFDSKQTNEAMGSVPNSNLPTENPGGDEPLLKNNYKSMMPTHAKTPVANDIGFGKGMKRSMVNGDDSTTGQGYSVLNPQTTVNFMANGAHSRMNSKDQLIMPLSVSNDEPILQDSSFKDPVGTMHSPSYGKPIGAYGSNMASEKYNSKSILIQNNMSPIREKSKPQEVLRDNLVKSKDGRSMVYPSKKEIL